jgi:DNA-binding PadR family transcriptional regulator
MAQQSRLDLLQGTPDLLILRTLQTGALHRMEHQGWIKAEWGVSELGRRARFYRLTASGRKQLELETKNWARLAAAIGRVLEMA